jgi:putative membrane-bound dehydrogenase-like protein
MLEKRVAIGSMRKKPDFAPLLLLLSWPILLLAACTGTAPLPPTPTPMPGPDRWLFTSTAQGASAVGGVTYCEQNGGAILRCNANDRRPLRLEVDGVGGNAYAVWRIELPEVTANAEDFQALGLRVRNMQGVLPYLYLIDQNGVRAYVSLLDYLIRPPDALSSDWLDVIVPFVWFADGEGRRPDIRRLAEFQIVFQWQAMAGTLEVDDVRFIHHVQWPLAGDTIVPATVQLPPGFEATVYAGASGLGSATTITWGPDGHLWLSQENGNIWKIADTDGDGRADKAFLFAAGFTELLGLLWHPSDGTLYASSRGRITALWDEDGDGRADRQTVVVDDLPWGRHQNNGLAWGPDGRLYFPLGSTGDATPETEPLAASILRMPHLGSRADIEVVATGFRNPYDLTFNARGDLFATENGPDTVDGPDELNHVLPGRHYGYPEAFGDDDGGGRFQKPIWNFVNHASADGLVAYEADGFPAEYRGNLFVALFGNLFGERVVGREVWRVIITPAGETYRAWAEPFMSGLERPLDVTVGPDGALYVLEHVSGMVYRVVWRG